MSVRKIALILALAVIAPASLWAAMTVKMATQAPVNSSWHKVLLDMGAEWEAKTAGRVKLTIYAGGTQGSEDATIRMMRPGVDQLQANLLMLSGLAAIDEGFNIFGVPFFFQSDAEGQYVLEKITPMLEKRLDAKGYKFLAWGCAGWVQLFSKKPMTSLADVKAAKLYTSQGNDRMVQWYKGNGFNPVALNANDIPAQRGGAHRDPHPHPRLPVGLHRLGGGVPGAADLGLRGVRQRRVPGAAPLRGAGGGPPGAPPLGPASPPCPARPPGRGAASPPPRRGRRRRPSAG